MLTRERGEGGPVASLPNRLRDHWGGLTRKIPGFHVFWWRHFGMQLKEALDLSGLRTRKAA